MLLLAVLVSSLTWLLAFSFGGIAAIVAGVFMVAGIGWALIFGGIASLAVALFISRGMSDALY